MKEYYIDFSVKGEGYCTIWANSEEEAERIFKRGDFDIESIEYYDFTITGIGDE